MGRLQRHFGLTIDNLAAVEVVTADGRLVRATETEEPDLFWGLRGAGWNFGIATAFEFRLSPFGPDLHRGVLTFDAAHALELWGIWREYALQAPDAVSMIFGFERATAEEGYPEDMVGKPAAYFAWNHSGRAEDAERDTAGLRAGPKPLTTTIGSTPYLEVQTAHDLVFQWGSRSYIKSQNVDDVRPEALEELVEQHRSRRWMDQPAQHPQRRRLAGPVGAKQRDDFARHQLERHVLHGKARIEALGQADDGFLRLDPSRHDVDGFFAAVLRRVR